MVITASTPRVTRYNSGVAHAGRHAALRIFYEMTLLVLLWDALLKFLLTQLVMVIERI